LTTILTKVEAVINSRPLVYVDNDIDSNHELAQNDFLSMNPNNVVSDYCFREKDKEYQPSSTVSNVDKLLKI